jgi:hypothetical protein
MNCNVCHNNTVTGKRNDLNPTCAACHNGTDAPTGSYVAVADKSFHVNGVVDVVFTNDKIRSKAQVRDDIFDVPELTNNWVRMNSYKLPDGSSYDESPDTLANMSANYGGWTDTAVTRYSGQPEEMTQPAGTCLISCHLWEKGRVDKQPVYWYENSRHNPDTSKHLMCIDCHTRLPK